MSTTRTQHPNTTGAPTTPPQDPNKHHTPWFKNPVVWGAVTIFTLFAVVIAGVLYINSRPAEPPQQPPAAAPADPAARQAEAQDAYQDYDTLLLEAYEARDVSPLIGHASTEVIDPLRDYFADMRYAEITASGETTATTEAVDFQADTPEGWDTVVLDVCTDSSEFALTLPDGTDASRAPDGSTDYLTRVESTVTMTNNVATGAERWVVQSIESDFATPC